MDADARRRAEIQDRWQRQHDIREAMRAKGVEPSSSWYDEDIPWLLERDRRLLDLEIAKETGCGGR